MTPRRPGVTAFGWLALLALGAVSGLGAVVPDAAFSALGTVVPNALPAQEPPPPLVLSGATIVDGTGAAGFLGDVIVRGGRIEAVGAPGSLTIPAGAVTVELEGLVLAPGFVDLHNHSTRGLFEEPLAPTQIGQGITTIAVGADGSSPWPIAAFLTRVDSLRPALDVAVMVGHGTLRRAVMGDDYRHPATDAEIAEMTRRVEWGMRDGAFGLSSGLEYDPGFYSETGELVALARVAAEHGGIYASHIRDEEEGLLDAVDEAIRVGREAGLPAHITHIKAGNASAWGQATEVLARIEAARAAGQDVTADQYPYAAWQSGLGIVVPSRRYEDADSVAASIARAGGGERLQIFGYDADPSVNGLRLSEIAARYGKSEVETYMEMMRNGGSGVIGHTMHDGDVEAFLTSPWVMTASDGGIGSAHPRGAGAFVRVLGHYVRERGLLTLERAIERATSQPARRLGLEDRGVIRPGARADLVVFDPETIADRATFEEPGLPPVGVRAVWVAGVAVWADGAPTGARPGRPLRHRPPERRP